MHKLLLIIIIVGGIGAAWWYASRPQPVAVRVALVASGDVRATVANTRVGTVEACRRTRMSPAAAGQVAVLAVSEGDRVAANDLLLEIWNKDRKAELRLAETRVSAVRSRATESCAIAKGAKREAGRLAKLRANKLVAEEIADNAATQADSAAAACEAAQAATRVSATEVTVAREAVEKTILRAPFAGIVAEVNAKLGEYLTPSPPGIATVPAIDLIDPGCVYVSAPIDEVDAPRIEAGMSACVTLDAFPDKYCDAEVTRVAPYVLEREKQARTVEVEVAFRDVDDAARLVPGYSADIEVLISTHENVLRIPTEAVIGDEHVLVFDPVSSRLRETDFEAGLSNWEYTEVLSGLTEGDQVVVSTGRAGVEDGVVAAIERDGSPP